MKYYIFSFLLLFFANYAFARSDSKNLSSSESDSLRFLGEFDNWSLYTQMEGGQKACFLVSSPIKTLGTYKSRKDQFLWVRYVNHDTDEVSVTPGYHFKDGTHPEISLYKRKNVADYRQNVTLDVKSNKCSFKNESASYMFDITDKSQAWVRDIETDKKIIKNMVDSNYAIVSAYSPKNTCSLDVYSLIGFTKAYKKMKQECNKQSKNK